MNKSLTFAAVLALLPIAGCAAKVDSNDPLNDDTDVATDAGGAESASVTTQAATTCYGDSCTGKDPVKMHCDRDTSRVASRWSSDGSYSVHLVISWNCAAMWALYIADWARYSSEIPVSERKRHTVSAGNGTYYWDEWQTKTQWFYTGTMWSPMNSASGGDHVACIYYDLCTSEFSD